MIAADYARPVLAMIFCGLISGMHWYGSLSLAAQLVVAATFQLPLLLWIMSWTWIKDLFGLAAATGDAAELLECRRARRREGAIGQ